MHTKIDFFFLHTQRAGGESRIGAMPKCFVKLSVFQTSFHTLITTCFFICFTVVLHVVFFSDESQTQNKKLWQQKQININFLTCS